MTRHFLSLSDAGGDTLAAMLNDAIDRKAARKEWPKARPDADAPLAGHVLAMIFEKNSTRTRVSFDMAMRQLGGSALIMEAGSTQLGRGETVADTARVLSRMVDAIMIRTDDHAKIEELAHYAEVPVINGLTDLSHPCQIVADLLTVVERGFSLPGLQVAWLGDGNNVANSLIEAAGQMKFTVRIGGPSGYEPNAGFIEQARAAGGEVILTQDPIHAVKGAQVVVTDTWVSMGQPGGEKHIAAMQPYQVNTALMAQADPGAMFLHCLPAHREEEVTNEVIDGPQSAVWDEAENRLHAQKSVLLWALGKL
ncbi:MULTISPECIES: ornithine carbamoyltransferase [Novosphingobium]|uniref:Ornithine carbamoyltransferase n=1 Tax=Novosphingobium mathurense TaxID=428990 RepID=A0A1U6HET6_9SPHN|nr:MULTISPECIES: ornithine carbamoyltransferase [Novosphingobium]CDO36833.1 ornithine carbamoyltransferase (OTCase) [Novosphingobium sp. KN65.2]SLJ94241.1 ornithine carbamoyltransferase [Novosphingobium mathurense]